MADLTMFHDTRFPTDIAIGSSGGPQRNTEIVTLGSGKEHRNQRWAHSRRRYEAGYGVKTLQALHEVVAFYEARRGPLHAFRYRDPLDWKSGAPKDEPQPVDQYLGLGTGSREDFALIKSYGSGGDAYARSIALPDLDTLSVAVDGVVAVQGAAYDFDLETSAIHFQPGHIPPQGAVVTAGYAFDVPVRFASDELTVSLSAFNAGDIPSIPLIEVVL
ncbi:MAG: DUF2460 domain-containing protein [Ahrensia sp.]|nr:DUF2460 domain-containing protein [Ahrensia sp.]